MGFLPDGPENMPYAAILALRSPRRGAAANSAQPEKDEGPGSSPGPSMFR